MEADDRLDALLSARQNGGHPPTSFAETGNDTLHPQLVVADLLAQRRAALPSAHFAADLEARLLAHAARRATSATSPAIGAQLAPDARNQQPRLIQREGRPAPQARWRLLGASRRLSTALLAASLLLALSVGILAAAASAEPGSPLFGLHQFEQNVRVGLASGPTDRAHLHLSYAQSDLAALDSSLAKRTGGPSYRDALAAFQNDLQATATDLRAVAPGGERDALTSQLSALQAQARSDLLAGLRPLPWTDRVATTAVLGSLGVGIPVVERATITRTVGQGTNTTQMVIMGSGFQPGAVAEVAGVQVGVVVAQSPTSLVVQLDARYPAGSIKEVGMSNPDGTSATTSNVLQVVDAGGGGQPTPSASPTPPGNGHPGGGPHGTPTPSH